MITITEMKEVLTSVGDAPQNKLELLAVAGVAHRAGSSVAYLKRRMAETSLRPEDAERVPETIKELEAIFNEASHKISRSCLDSKRKPELHELVEGAHYWVRLLDPPNRTLEPAKWHNGKFHFIGTTGAFPLPLVEVGDRIRSV